VDLKPARALLAPAVAALLGGACASETPVEYGSDPILLPATLGDALPLAEDLARDLAERPYVTRLGGGLAVMDSEGRAWNHSFVFHAREGPSILRKITVHLVHGIPWVDVVTVSDAPPPFPPALLGLDSDGVVARAIQLAPQYGLDLPAAYAARLSVVPAWPEPETVDDQAEEVAWRVDFLKLTPIEGTSVWFSTARFYFDPVTAEPFDDPVIPEAAELYPFP
jgi:hypothetical protein